MTLDSESENMNVNCASALGNVLIVGGGRMGQAIIGGLLRIDGVFAASITVANPGTEKRQAVADKYGVRTVADASQGLPADTVIIAVKPNHVEEVALSLAAAGIPETTRLISIAAGVSTAKLEKLIGNKLPIIRVMPNTPLMCGCGMSAISGGSTASEQDCELARDVFAHMGHAVIVDEDQQDVVTALSGSGPAYFELFVETMARAAEKIGMPYETALDLALQTMHGTAELIEQTGQDLPSAIDAVSSPGGTTVAALDTMRAKGVQDAIEDGIIAAAQRSKELGA
jgi:pyrroline-5-carboxylate reductase